MPSIQDLADANLLEALREHARWQNPCECVEDDGVLMMAGPNAFPVSFRNCVVRVGDAIPAARVLERARDYFAKRDRGYTVLARASRDKDIEEEAYETIKLPAAETRIFFGRHTALLSPQVVGFVAYRDAVPVSTALTLLSGAGAGVYWVGTAPHAQRSGLGEVCTRLATNAGFANGASVVTLQASSYGEPLYQRLGYKTYDRLLRFRCPEPTKPRE